MYDHATQKKTLRKNFLSLRTKLRAELGETWEKSLVYGFLRHLEEKQIHFGGPILSFFPIQDEPKILPNPNEGPWYFPKTVGSDMLWFPWAWGEAIPPPGNYRIPEAETAFDIVEVLNGSNAICFAPALAVDLKGYRLGYGKGFYDRFLAKPELQNRIVSVVILHEDQVVNKLPSDSHDTKVDLCVTNKRILYFSEEAQVLKRLGN